MKKIALVGIGKMGMSHVAIANMTEGMNVVALCDTSSFLMKFFNKNTAFECFTDYKKMLRKIEFDSVIVSVPNAFHFEIVQFFLDNGKDVFIEKPFTMSYKHSNELIDLARSKNLKLQVGYVNRFNPIFQKVKSLLGSGVIGDITNYINRMTGGVVLKESKGWRNDYSKGGGALFDYGIHCLDLATYFFGTDVEVESASLKKVFSTDVDDIVYATLIHGSSIVGFNYINWSDSSVRKAGNNIEIFGEKGKIIASKQEVSIYLSNESVEHGLHEGWNQIYITDESTDVNYYLRGEDFSRQMEEFSELIHGKTEGMNASLHSSGVIDYIVEEIFKKSGELK